MSAIEQLGATPLFQVVKGGVGRQAATELKLLTVHRPIGAERQRFAAVVRRPWPATVVAHAVEQSVVKGAQQAITDFRVAKLSPIDGVGGRLEIPGEPFLLVLRVGV